MYFQHTSGAVSMANFGPDSNNSQFFITSGDCPNLDGTHVVCGYVLRGFEIISDMEKVSTEEGTLTTDILIVGSGELNAADETTWNFYDADDNLPPFPADWAEAEKYEEKDVEEVLKLLDTIKTLGNRFFNDREVVSAFRKYKKVISYLKYFTDSHAGVKAAADSFSKLQMENMLNMAACLLKLERFAEVVTICNDVIRGGGGGLSKAFYRRGVAEIEMKEYDSALADLKQAHAMTPNDKNILEQFNRGKALLLEYRKTERTTSQKMFRDLQL